MSRALDYLLKARPRAMGAYFEFLKENGSRLEPKTRALISVIAKVAVQTEAGLVQYTRKALATGATPDEILDALMMAFPALGLSRIVWAVDVLIEHDVEGFAAADEELAATTEVLDVCEMTALPMEQAVKYSSLGRPLLLFRSGDSVRAFKAYCAHQGMELMSSGIQGMHITCRQHGWRFDMPDGSCSRGRQWSLQELPARIDGGRVMVEWRD